MLALPESTLTLCEALYRLCAITWIELEAGHKTRQPLCEESVTDYNLLRLSASVPSIIIEKHSKRREAITGADWEWWIGQPGEYVGFRVQAKVLDYRTAEYPSLYHKRGAALDQINRLIRAAESGEWVTYPLFAFYNSWRPGLGEPTWCKCLVVDHVPQTIGWTLMSAYTLRKRLTSCPTKKLLDFRENMRPVFCLHCCKGNCDDDPDSGPAPSLARAAAARTSRWWPEDINPVLHQVGPVYIERMYKGETPEHGWIARRRFTGIPPERYIPRDLSHVVLVRDGV